MNKCAHQHTCNRTQWVESLREVQPPLRAFRISQLSNEGIGRRFKKRKPTRNYEQSEQEKSVPAHNRCWPEQKSPQAKQQQAYDKSSFVSQPAHKNSRRDREHKVAHVESGLNQSGLEARDRERLHKLPDQHVVEIVGNSPQEEERRYQNERYEVSRWEQGRGAGFAFSG